MKFYRMYGEQCVQEYARPDPMIVRKLEKACQNSDVQFLRRMERLNISLGDEGGIEFPDFLQCGDLGSVVLVKDKVKMVFDGMGVDNLFYEQVHLKMEEVGIDEPYWLVVPPRINCLNFDDKSDYDGEDNDDYPKRQLMLTAKKIKIIAADVGNFQIFKLAGVTNQDIIVTEPLKNALDREHFENIYFCEV